MSLILSCCLLALPQPETLVTTPRRIETEEYRDCAVAQVGQGSFREPGEGDEAGWLQHELPHGDVPMKIGLKPTDDTGFEYLWADLDRDGQRIEDECLDLGHLSWRRGFETVPLNDFDLPYSLNIFASPKRVAMTVMTHYHFEADVEIDGEPIQLVIIDMDLDGAPSSGDQWLALGSRQLESIRPASMMFSSCLWSEPWYFGERILLPQSVQDDGDLVLALRPQDRPRSEFLAERCQRVRKDIYAAYDKGRDAFLQQFEIDPDRPEADTPATWHHAATMADALAYAKAEGRPLYVEFGSDGCPWCSRYDWLNYRDAEVVERLSRFALVKINRDLDPDQTAPGLGMDGVPCHALFDHEGHAVHQSNGWTPTHSYVAKLDQAWEAWQEHQAGN